MKLSSRGVDLITRWEGCRLTAYRDGGGVLTIGYGHTSAAGEPTVREGLTITQAQAREIFARDAAKYEAAVSKALTRTPTQAQFDAMVSLCYNIGAGAFAKSSVARKFNAGDLKGAADAFALWNKDNGKVVKGLERRRADEARHFALEIPAVQPPPTPVAPIVPPKPETPPAAQISPPRGLLKAILGLIVAIFAPKKG